MPVQGYVKMASTSRAGGVLRDEELLDVFNALPSDVSDFSDSDKSDNEAVFCDNYQESDESESESVPPINTVPQTKGKRPRHNPPIFQWQRGDFRPKFHQFSKQNSGILVDVDENCSILEIFKLFFPLHIMQHIADETNKYYNFLCQKFPPTPGSRLNAWTNTTPEELYLFFGITMLMARVKKLTINEYWSKDPLLITPQFADYMSRDRYLLLLRCLHFNDNETEIQGERLHKLKPIIDHLRNVFSAVFSPFENLCIDESLVLFKGRLLFLQFIPSKRHRFGIKIFVLCDCETGYILDFIIYTGADTDLLPGRDFGVSGAVVQTLMQKYLHKGHSLYLDNWYSSPLLYNWLHENQTDACGTVRKNRKEMPMMTKKLKKGETDSMHTDNMLALRWLDKREVTMLSTLHTDTKMKTGKVDRATQTDIEKPTCVVDYNKNMGAVDRSDMMVSSLECVRKSLKWYRKLFFHLLDITLLNSHAIYNVKTGKNINLADFHISLIREIFQEYHRQRPTPKFGRPSSGDQPLRLIERHFLSTVPPTEKTKKPSRRCHVCAHTTRREKKRKETKCMCTKCDVGLCMEPCFQIFHTELNF